MTKRFTRRRTVGAIAAAAIVAGLSGAVAAPAAAAPLGDADYIGSIGMSWDGSDSYAASTTENFFSAPVSIPGDSATRTLTVRNDGPTDGTLRVTIVDVELLDPDAPDVRQGTVRLAGDDTEMYGGPGDQGRFYDDLQVSWGSGEVSMTELNDAGQATMTELSDNWQTRILQIPLAQGEAVPISISYELPVATTSGNRANVAPRLAAFDLLLELGGEFPDDPAAAPVSADAPPGTQTQPSSMPETGADLRWPALAVAVLLALGTLLVRTSRRREDVRGHH